MIPPDEEKVAHCVVSIFISLDMEHTVCRVSVNRMVASPSYSNPRRNAHTGPIDRNRDGWMRVVEERTRYHAVVEISGKGNGVASPREGNYNGNNDHGNQDDCGERYYPVTAPLVFHLFQDSFLS